MTPEDDHGIFAATGAYGRVPTEADWIGGKDFHSIQGYAYFSIRDAQRIRDLGFHRIEFWDFPRTAVLFRIDLDA